MQRLETGNRKAFFAWSVFFEQHNKQQTTNNKQQTTNNKQQTTNNKTEK
jgi:hypothetical protein